jgi:ABC-2 type transport system ATP-binding protein
MWRLVRELRDAGTTIILTTHYLEEAEDMADRIGVINKGELVVVEDKDVLMRKLGKKQLTLALQAPLERIPADLSGLPLELSDDRQSLVYTFDTQTDETGIAALLRQLGAHGIDFKDLHSSESSLEEIFVSLVHGDRPGPVVPKPAPSSAGLGGHGVPGAEQPETHPHPGLSGPAQHPGRAAGLRGSTAQAGPPHPPEGEGGTQGGGR